MLRPEKGIAISTYGFLVGVELEDTGSTTPSQVANRLADSLSFMEGTGEVDVESLGKVDIYPEEDL